MSRNHRPLGRHVPVCSCLSSFLICACVFVKVTLHPALQSVPMEISEWVLKPGRMWAVVASVGRLARLRLHVWDESIEDPSGSLTESGVVACCKLL